MIPSYILYALLISFLWGIQPIIHKYLLQKINGITILVLSSFVYFIASFLISFITKNHNIIIKDLKIMNRKDYMIIIFTTFFTVFLANIIYYYILKRHQTSFISSLINSAPIFTLIVSYLFLKENIEPIGVIGILLMTLGVFCVSFNNDTVRILEYYKDYE
jgi:uncharacterized membrane protein